MADKYLNLQGLTEVAGYVNKRLRIVTTMPASPELKDVVLYDGTTTATYKQGSIYLYTTVMTYYGWSDGTDTFFTLAAAPEIGDTVYSDAAGTNSGFTIDAYDSTNDEVTFNSLTYGRDVDSDTPINTWVCKSGTSIILNGQDKTGDEANFYAPTASGTTGQVLVSNGADVTPSWATYTGYAPQFVDNTLFFYYGLEPEVDEQTIFFNVDD